MVNFYINNLIYVQELYKHGMEESPEELELFFYQYRGTGFGNGRYYPDRIMDN
jgi:hypothetical protein